MKSSIQHGFETTLLRHELAHEDNNDASSESLGLSKDGRLLLISKQEPEDINNKHSRSPKKPLRNRKKIIFEDYIIHNEKSYKINSSKSGIYEQIIHRIIEQFEIAASKWNRLFVLRFDLHSHYYSANNKRVSKFRDRLFKRLKREYGFEEIGYCWVRELERAKTQHYHWIIILDGNLVRHSSRINKIIKESWEDETGAHHVPIIKNPYYFGKLSEICESVIDRASYLAKARGKGYRHKQAKDYQCSRMRLKE